MNSDQLDRQIHEIERSLLRDDPSFARRLRRLDQPDRCHDTIVFSLLAVSALLLAVGMATLAPIAWLAGASAFISSFVVDARYERRLDQLFHLESTRPTRNSTALDGLATRADRTRSATN